MERSLSEKAAKIISTLFVPPAFTILIFTYFSLTVETEVIQKSLILTVTFLFGFTFHVLLFFYLRSKGKISDSEATIKEERSIPFILSTIIYIAGFVILLYSNVNIVVTAFWFCYISNTLLILIINKYWKISAHLMGAAGPMAALSFVMGNYAFFFIILLLILGWARLTLKCHNHSQLIAGALTGFISTYLQMYLIIKIYG
jgi:membrane-associated phospholipid phosphatase